MRILVSVVSPEEVAAALDGGADIVDVKNPAEGALGAAAPETLLAVRSLVGPSVEVSAALGDAPHLPGTLALAAFGAALCGVDTVKVGLLGSREPPAALTMLHAVRGAALRANPRVRVVAVAYADAGRVGALPPTLLPALAAEAGVHGAMLDTAIKDGTSSLAALGEREVAAFLADARGRGLLAGLAGSLSPGQLRSAGRLGADWVGVRGAACDGGRNGRVSAPRVRALREALGISAPASRSSRPAPAARAAAPGAAR